MNALSSERRVLTYGTFDLMHYGHVRLLRRLSTMGDRLIVGLSTDAFTQAKGKQAVMSFEERREMLMACRYVDRVIAEESWEQKRTDIVNYNIALFAMGHDWAGQFDHLSDLAQVIYLDRTPGISSATIKERVRTPDAKAALIA